MSRLTGIVLILLSGAAFGANPIFARFAYADQITPATLLFLRFTLAAVCLGVIALARGMRLPPRRSALTLLLMGGIGYFGQSFMYFTALNYASTGLVALLLYVNPALVAVLSAVFLRERLTRLKLLALVLALVGTVFTVGTAGGGSALGIALALGAAGMYAVYILVGTQVIRQVTPLQSTTLIITAAACSFAVVALLEGLRLPTSASGWLAIVGIALISTILAIGAFFAGLNAVGGTNAATLSTIEPVVTIGLAALLLGESITLLHLVGGALILTAVVLLARGDAAKTKRPAAPPGRANTAT